MLTTSLNAQQKYAVLICGESPSIDPTTGSWDLANPVPDNGEHDEFWKDTYLMWEMLIEKGYDNDHIYVLFASGNDWPTYPDTDVADRYNPRERHCNIIGNEGHITDYWATRSNVDMVLNGLANGNNTEEIPQLNQKDFLFVWTFGHGAITTTGHSKLMLKSGSITDQEFYTKIQQINCDKKVLWGSIPMHFTDGDI